MFVRVSGVWKNPHAIHVRVSGSWRKCRYSYVRVAGTWRREWRAADAMYDGNITMGYTNFAGVDNWGFSNGNYGSASPTTCKDGSVLQLAQIANDSRGAYGARRWMQIALPGNVPGADIVAVNFAGNASVEKISGPTYISAFGVTEWIFGFSVQLPTTGTFALKL